MQLGLLLSETKVDHEECPDGVEDAIKDIRNVGLEKS